MNTKIFAWSKSYSVSCFSMQFQKFGRNNSHTLERFIPRGKVGKSISLALKFQIIPVDLLFHVTSIKTNLKEEGRTFTELTSWKKICKMCRFLHLFFIGSVTKPEMSSNYKKLLCLCMHYHFPSPIIMDEYYGIPFLISWIK